MRRTAVSGRDTAVRNDSAKTRSRIKRDSNEKGFAHYHVVQYHVNSLYLQHACPFPCSMHAYYHRELIG